MKDVNKVILVGRLGADPIQRSTQAGRSVVNFSVATSRKTKEAAEGQNEARETQWHRVVAWGKEGEACAQYLRKGAPVFVEGMLRSHEYEAANGKRTSYEIHAERVSFLPFRGRAAKVEEAVPLADDVVH